MLKVGYLVVLIAGSCLADTYGDPLGYNINDSLNNIKGLHYSQHEASVNAARRGAAERLSRISSASSAGGAPCGSTICYSSSGFSDNSDAETLGHGIVGFSGGSTGASSSSSKYQASAQHESVKNVVPVYPVISGGKSSYSSASQRHSASSVSSAQPVNYVIGTDGVKTRSNFAATSGSSSVVQPIIATAYPIGQDASHSSYSGANLDSSSAVYAVPVDSSNAYRSRSSYATASERESASVSQPIVPVYSTNEQASKYVASGRQDGYQRYTPSNTYVVYGKPVPVYTSVGSNLDSSARLASHEGTVYAPVKVYPVRTSSQYSSANEQQSYSSIDATPRPLYVSSSDQSSQSAANYRQSSAYRPVYQPVYTNRLSAVNTEEENVDHSVQSVVPVAPIVSSSSKHHEERHEDYSRKGSTYVPVALNTGSTASHRASYDQRRTQAGSTYVPIVGGQTASTASQYASEDRRQDHRASYVPVAPVASSSSSSSKYSAQEHRQQQGQSYVPIVPAGESTSSSASRYSAQERRQQQLAGGSYYPVPVGSASQGSRYSASEAASAYNQQVKAGGYSRYPITPDDLGQRFGSAGLSLGDNNDLGEIMSESERLAKLQAKNAYNGAVSGSSAIDTANRFGDDQNISSGIDTGAGGFKRTKSWSSSSKWASGQKYDDEGKIKSYSSLSTAESEQHNIDGKKTGYKAATTTLEDDGKVSTYSLHTP
ncbi:uncharacterized protein LOC128741529 isoform X2 [Sabethes cyaneus]|uniref:uncharacterized protein LOC128741529 isoform X2 n=1 Tax=Sabethes cyaneus TaxID=53552 RepID=UPI00237EAE3A|nr:uncharacterized protein LOC128741529 isoform X2 [Sabethes cyaneus]